jgi:hypothetical protein
LVLKCQVLPARYTVRRSSFRRFQECKQSSQESGGKCK